LNSKNAPQPRGIFVYKLISHVFKQAILLPNSNGRHSICTSSFFPVNQEYRLLPDFDGRFGCGAVQLPIILTLAAAPDAFLLIAVPD